MILIGNTQGNVSPALFFQVQRLEGGIGLVHGALRLVAADMGTARRGCNRLQGPYMQSRVKGCGSDPSGIGLPARICHSDIQPRSNACADPAM